MATLAEFRTKFPQYDDMSDAQLADGLYRKHYSDIPRAEFDQKIGLAPVEATGVTIAPKGAAPRMASAEEAREINPGASMADVASAAGENLLPSAQRFAGDMLSVVTDPIGTAKNIGNVAVGGVQKLIPGEQGKEQYANAVGRFFADRYGGLENVKRTLAGDPVGFAADLSTVLSGGALIPARAGGVVGQVGRAVGQVGKAIDPINATLKAAKVGGKGVGKVAAEVSGVLTGAGGNAIQQAARAGFEGGEAGRAFRENLTGSAKMEDVLVDSQKALSNIRQKRSAAYDAGMADVRLDKRVLDFRRIEHALNATRTRHTFKGVSLSPSSESTLKALAQEIADWKAKDPKDFHTAEGFDALKQRIGDIYENAEHGTPQQKIAREVYNVVKDQIVKQAPHYAKTMDNYQQASDLIRDIEKTLSQKPGQSIDTQLRKLQSVMRSNVNTNFGRRAELAKLLEANGAKNLMDKLAGQALSAIAPQGLARMAGSLGGIGTIAGGVIALNPKVLAMLVAQGLAQSPRVAGTVAHGGGYVAKGLNQVPARPLAQLGYQAGRDYQ